VRRDDSARGVNVKMASDITDQGKQICAWYQLESMSNRCADLIPG
jgi:hypothetical protein